MDKKPKIINGEVVEEAPTKQLIKRDPQEPRLPSLTRKKNSALPPDQQAVHDRLVKHIDTTDIERRLVNTYAGGFIGMGYEEPCDSCGSEQHTTDEHEEIAERVVEKNPLIIITDKDDLS